MVSRGVQQNLLHDTREDCDKNKKTWPNKLLGALWTYRIMIRTSKQATPYSLVFGEEAIITLKNTTPIIKTDCHEEITDENGPCRIGSPNKVRFAAIKTLNYTVIGYLMRSTIECNFGLFRNVMVLAI